LITICPIFWDWDKTTPDITSNIPIILSGVKVSPSMKKENKPVNTGMRLVKTLAFIIPIPFIATM
jgi:hypothetical protein